MIKSLFSTSTKLIHTSRVYTMFTWFTLSRLQIPDIRYREVDISLSGLSLPADESFVSCIELFTPSPCGRLSPPLSTMSESDSLLTIKHPSFLLDSFTCQALLGALTN